MNSHDPLPIFSSQFPLIAEKLSTLQIDANLPHLLFVVYFRIAERKHLTDLAKLEDIREGKEIQELTRLHRLEIQEREQKLQEEKVERRRAHLV